MAENTKIEWATHTFNPWVGCTKVSPACDHCYAEGWAKRTGQTHLWAGDRRRTSAANWRQPIKWNKSARAQIEAWETFRDLHGMTDEFLTARGHIKPRRPRVFCASLADVFDNQVPELWRDDLWRLIATTPHLDWLLLTKRPQNIRKMLPMAEMGVPDWGNGWQNVWLGATVETQVEADRRIPLLLATPAAVRWVSAEPLLGPVDLIRTPRPGDTWDWLTGERETALEHTHTARIDWVVAGGESGPGARPSHPDWFRSLRDQCESAEVAFFFKQHGDWREWDHHPVTEEVDADGEMAAAILASAHRPAWITRDGCVVHRRQDLPEGVPCRLVERLGKARAGRLLDGVEHNGMPGHG